jgi:tRNA (guanine37-N1)-methyltransferase
LKRARELGLLEVSLHQLRDYAGGRHLQVDDVPYGGGQGMVMKPEPLVVGIEHVAAVEKPRRILLAARGARLDQRRVDALAREQSLLLVCGRYEGVDERVAEHLCDDELSIGDYVLAGGEAAALVVIEAVARLVPGVLGNEASPEHESFTGGLLEEPQYTRPAEYRGWEVPAVLRSGDHARIAAWRAAAALRRTRDRRPDLLAGRALTPEEQAALDGEPPER